jgi:hypothetical protein
MKLRRDWLTAPQVLHRPLPHNQPQGFSPREQQQRQKFLQAARERSQPPRKGTHEK